MSGKEWFINFENCDFSSIRVDMLPLPTRAINCMLNNGVYSLAQLLVTPVEDMYQWRNMGKGSIDKVNDFISAFDLSSIDKNTERLELYNATTEQIKESKFINEVYPISYTENYKILFISENDTLYENMNIDHFISSKRLNSFINENAIETAIDFLLVPSNLLHNWENIGINTIHDAIRWFQKHTRIIVSQSKIDDFDLCMKRVVEYYSSLGVSEDSTFFAAVRNNIADFVLHENVFLNDLDFLDSGNLYYSRIFENENVVRCEETDIIRFLENRESASPYDIYREFAYFPDIERLNILLTKMVNDKKIERLSDSYRILYPCVSEWIESLPGNRKQKMLKDRLEGKTLEEIGIAFNVSRERVRQILNRLLSCAPRFKEDYDRFWYEEYDFNEDEMIQIIGVSVETYRYYSLRYKKGKKSLNLLPNDSRATSKILKSYYGYVYRDSILIEGEWVLKNRPALLNKYIEIKCAKPLDSSQIRQSFHSFLVDIGMGEEFFYSQEGTFRNYLDSYVNLLKGRNGFRYYPLNDYDISDLVNKLHLERFSNVIISTLKLYKENKELMNEFDIKDYYELHNILRKYNASCKNIEDVYKFRIGRMPNLYFGEVSIENQLVKFIRQNSPISVGKFADLIEEEYGLNRNTILINYSKYLSKYLYNGEYCIHGDEISQEEISYLKLNLNKDFYFKSDVQSVYQLKFPEMSLDRFNRYTWNQIGYIQYSQYLVSNKYSSALDFFTELCMQNDYLDISKLDPRITGLSYFSNVLYDLLANLELIEYDYHKFVKIEKFLTVINCDSSDILKDYVNQVILYSKQYKYFTVTQLNSLGFHHELYGCGIEREFFYNALLRNSRRLFYLRLGDYCFFMHENEDISLASFIKWYIKDDRSIRIYTFIDRIAVEYGVFLKKDQIVKKIKDTSIYYDSDLDKIYLSKNDYYQDL